MAASKKLFESKLVGQVDVTKNKKSKSLRLKFDKTNGQLTVTQPSWLPYEAGLKFAESRQDWVVKNRPQVLAFRSNDMIGRRHVLSVCFQPKTKAVVSKSKITVSAPNEALLDQPDTINIITKACYRALKIETEALVEARIQVVSKLMNATPTNLHIRRTHSRWGSCNSKQEISFSIFLAQLPDELVDYVIVHEFAHLEHLNHSSQFWQRVESVIPNYKKLRLQLKDHSPALKPNVFA